MGAHATAIRKFYAVITSSLNLKLGELEYYQRLVLQAQTEIVDTYFLEGNLEESGRFFQLLLRLDSPKLNRAQIQFKLIRSLPVPLRPLHGEKKLASPARRVARSTPSTPCRLAAGGRGQPCPASRDRRPAPAEPRLGHEDRRPRPGK